MATTKRISICPKDATFKFRNVEPIEFEKEGTVLERAVVYRDCDTEARSEGQITLIKGPTEHLTCFMPGTFVPCEALDNEGNVFVRCDAASDSASGFQDANGFWYAPAFESKKTKDRYYAKRWALCDMHAMLPRVWLPLLFLFLALNPVPVAAISADEGSGFMYQCFGWASLIGVVSWALFLAGLLPTIRTIGFRYAECFDTFSNRVGHSIDNFTMEYKRVHQQKLMLGMAIGVGSLLFGLSGLCFAGVSSQNYYQPEGRLRSNVNRLFKGVAGLCSVFALLQATWGDTKGAKEGPGFWSSLLRDNYLVWGISNIGKVMKNWWKGRAWNEGMVDADPKNLTTTKPKTGWMWSPVADPGSDECQVDAETDQAVRQNFHNLCSLKGGGGKGESAGDLNIELRQKAAPDSILVSCHNRITAAISTTLFVGSAQVVGPDPWSHRVQAAAVSMNDLQFEKMQRELWQYRPYFYVAGDLGNIAQACPTPRILMVWFMALAGPETLELWERIKLSWCTAEFSLKRDPGVDNHLDITFLVWLGASLGLAHEVVPGTHPNQQIVTLDMTRLYMQVCKAIKADHTEVWDEQFKSALGTDEFKKYDKWRKEIQNIRRIFRAPYSKVPVVLSFTAPTAEPCVNVDIPYWSKAAEGVTPVDSVSLNDVIKVKVATDEHSLEVNRSKDYETQLSLEAIAKDLGLPIEITKEVSTPSATTTTSTTAEYTAQSLDFASKKRLRLLHAMLRRNQNKVLGSLYDIMPNLDLLTTNRSSLIPVAAEVHANVHNTFVTKAETMITMSRKELDEWRAALDAWWNCCETTEHREFQTKAETQWFAVHNTLCHVEADRSFWTHCKNKASEAIDSTFLAATEMKPPSEWKASTWVYGACGVFVATCIGVSIWGHLTAYGRYANKAEKDAALAKFWKDNYPDGFWNGVLVPEARWGPKHKNRAHAPYPNKKAHPQNSGGAEVETDDLNPTYVEFYADHVGEARVTTLLDKVYEKLQAVLDGVTDPARLAAITAGFASLKGLIGDQVHVEDVSDLKEKLTKTRGKLVPARKVAGRRVAVRQESLLGKKQLNVTPFLNRLFKVRVDEPGMFNKTHLCNGWVHGDQLITVWHVLRHACGEQNPDGSYQVNENFKKAWNASHSFTRALKIVRLPDRYNDAGALYLTGVAALGARIPLTPPAQAERVWFLGWNQDHDGYEPKVATGIITADGLHNCPTEEGDCGGILVSEDSGSVVAFHNGGGSVNNRSSPVSESMKKALKEKVSMHLN